MKKLLIFDHNPSPEERASISCLSPDEWEEISRFLGQQHEPWAIAHGSLWILGIGRKVRLGGWDALKVENYE